jgi:hypothetical protein
MREEKHCTDRIARLKSYIYYFCFIVFLKKRFFIDVDSLFMFFKDMGGTIMFNTVEQKPAMNLLFFHGAWV